MTERKTGVNGFVLKWIAMICMLIDHMGAVLFPQYIEMRMIGRLAFPIYCFLLVEGAMHTSDIRKYELRLLLFAFLSEVPFDLAFYGKPGLEHQNVFFTLFLGLVLIDRYQRNRQRLNNVLLFILVMVAAEILHTDYGAGGIILIFCFYALYEKALAKQIAFVLANLLIYGFGVQMYAGFAAIPMLLYNGRRGPAMKYFFYIFYPAHLLILYFIKYVI